MIKRLDIKDYENKQTLVWVGIINKLNLLIDAVNSMQNLWLEVATMKKMILELQTHVENEKDEFAEQRKWIGKVCKFWNDNDEPENYVYGVLCNIFDRYHEGCSFQCGNGEWYEYCQPVKPDDDRIYKGGDNE